MADDDDAPKLYGMDAEHMQKMKDKYDPEYEREALDWIEKMVGDKVADIMSLKSGIVLCKLINAIRPGTIKLINMKPIAVCERENLRSYIAACGQLGVPSSELFVISDLYEKKSLPAVVTNIYGLGRTAQGLNGYTGPILGVKYNVTEEEQRARNKRKEAERQEEQRKYEEYDNERKKRREHLEKEKTEKLLERQTSEAIKINNRRTVKGRKNIDVVNPRRVSMSPVRFGMDLEIQQKLESRFAEDFEMEDAVLDWIELLTGDEVDDLYISLRSGEVLCQLLNVIYPGTIAKYNKKNIPALHRENIQKYLQACEKLGIPKHELFIVSDLYDRKGLPAVLTNLFALARITQVECETNGRINGSLVVKAGKPVVVSKLPFDHHRQTPPKHLKQPQLQGRSSPQNSPQQDRRSRRRSLRSSLVLQPGDAVVQQPQLQPRSRPSSLLVKRDQLNEPLIPKEGREEKGGCCCIIL